MTETPTRVCIIGAGAVALVYARYLQNAGAEVSLLVKPQYEVVALLRKGGMSARRQSDLPGRSAERSATTVPIIAGLEAAGWSIAGFTAGPWLPLSLSASREA